MLLIYLEMSSKRQHKTLALQDKMDILKRLDSGDNMIKLSKEYGVGRTTIYDLRKNREKIVKHVQMMKSGPGKRKTLKFGNCPKMENALYTWFMQERSKHNLISGEILQAKAIEFYQKATKKNDFRASVGWLDRFKRRFGIRLLAVSGKKQAVNKVETQQDTQTCQAKKKEAQEKKHVEISSTPTTIIPKITPDTAFNCFTTCIKWAEENSVSDKNITVLRNLQEKVFKDMLRLAKHETSISDCYNTNDVDFSYSENEGPNIITALYPEVALSIDRKKVLKRNKVKNNNVNNVAKS